MPRYRFTEIERDDFDPHFEKKLFEMQQIVERIDPRLSVKAEGSIREDDDNSISQRCSRFIVCLGEVVVAEIEINKAFDQNYIYLQIFYGIRNLSGISIEL